MAENEKEHGFVNIMRDGLSYISKIILASIFPQIAEGAEMVMKTIDDRILRIEKRILRKLSSLLIIGFGLVFLVLALFFFLIDSLYWSKAAAYFSVGILIFVIGLLLKIGESDK